MQTEKLSDYLGHSIKSENLNKLMLELELDTDPPDNLDYEGNRYSVKSYNNSDDIIFTFEGFKRYLIKYGEPKSINNKESDELILSEIDLDNDFEDKGNPFIFPLPISLKQGDSADLIIEKIGKKPNEKSSTSYGHAWWFYMDEYKILTALNKKQKLIWLRLIKLEKSELEKIKLKNELSAQRKNIKPENSELVESFHEKIPTEEWKERLKQGDDIFTEKNINAIETILHEYVDTLTEFTKTKKAGNIYNSVKKVVNSINKINAKYYYFIDTVEREELCEFIDEIIKATGFKLDKDIDLTEEWREW